MGLLCPGGWAVVPGWWGCCAQVVGLLCPGGGAVRRYTALKLYWFTVRDNISEMMQLLAHVQLSLATSIYNIHYCSVYI